MHIDKKNCIQGNCNTIKKLDTILGDKNKKTFLLIFMEGCGPCNATRPEWSKLKNVLSPIFLKKNNIVIASIDHELTDKLTNLKTKPSGFPTMRFITEAGDISENYEDSNIEKKDRTIDSFVEWIYFKNGNDVSKQTKRNVTYKKRKQNGGKWSLKYKRSINCKRPKGFSQKQHCKYGRKNYKI